MAIQTQTLESNTAASYKKHEQNTGIGHLAENVLYELFTVK